MCSRQGRIWHGPGRHALGRQPQAPYTTACCAGSHAHDNGGNLGLLVQWNCHPESMGSRNTLLTADFPAYTVEALRKRHGCPVAYFSGGSRRSDGPARQPHSELGAGSFHRREILSMPGCMAEAVADLAGTRQVEAAEPITLTPLAASAKPIERAAVQSALSERPSAWVCSKHKGASGRATPSGSGEPADRHQRRGVTMAVGKPKWPICGLGELHVACIPGEISSGTGLIGQ